MHQFPRPSEPLALRRAVLLSRPSSSVLIAVAIRSLCAANDLARYLHEENLRIERIVAGGGEVCGFVAGGLARQLRIELIATNVAVAFGVALLVARRVAFCCAFAWTAALLLFFGLTRGIPPFFSVELEGRPFILALGAAIAALVLGLGEAGGRASSSPASTPSRPLELP